MRMPKYKQSPSTQKSVHNSATGNRESMAAHIERRQAQQNAQQQSWYHLEREACKVDKERSSIATRRNLARAQASPRRLGGRTPGGAKILSQCITSSTAQPAAPESHPLVPRSQAKRKSVKSPSWWRHERLFIAGASSLVLVFKDDVPAVS